MINKRDMEEFLPKKIEDRERISANENLTRIFSTLEEIAKKNNGGIFPENIEELTNNSDTIYITMKYQAESSESVIIKVVPTETLETLQRTTTIPKIFLYSGSESEYENVLQKLNVKNAKVEVIDHSFFKNRFEFLKGTEFDLIEEWQIEKAVGELGVNSQIRHSVIKEVAKLQAQLLLPEEWQDEKTVSNLTNILIIQYEHRTSLRNIAITEQEKFEELSSYLIF